MIKLKLFLPLLILLSVCFSFASFAQEETKDQLYWIREEVVDVSKWDQYEQTSKQWVDLMNEGGLDLPYVRASQRDDGHYYYLIPLNNYAEIDNFPDVFGSAVNKIGKEKWDSFMQENESSMITHKDFIAKRSGKYSYDPKEPRIKPEETGFLHWIFFSYKLEKRKEILEVLAEWKKLYEDNNIPEGWGVWIIEIGEANNMMAIVEGAKDGESFYAAMDDESRQKIKDDENKLWVKFSKNVISIDEKFGKPRPDLSYFKK